MYVVGADQADDPVGLDHVADARLYASQPEAHLLGFEELVNVCQLGRALGVHEVNAFEIKDDRTRARRMFAQPAEPILERFGGCEEQTAIEADNPHPVKRLVAGVFVARNTCVPGSRPSSGIGGLVAT